MDFIFTKYELKALDDLMPESHKEKNENDDEEVTMLSVHLLTFDWVDGLTIGLVG